MMNNKLKVMLATEGTYPYHQGGVSTWCDILTHRLPTVDYTIYSIIMNPFVTQKFRLPAGAGLIKVPLWGTEEPSEHLTTPFSQVYVGKKMTVDQVIRGDFLPLFVELVDEFLNEEKNPQRLAIVLSELNRYFQQYDYRMSFKSELTWDVFRKIVMARAGEGHRDFEDPSVFSVIQSLGWIYRFFNILNTPVPKVDVSHSAAAAFCGVPCVLAKEQNKTPFLLTEHGVYLREQYLSLGKRGYPTFLNTFLMRMIHSVVMLNYTFADQVSPVCEYNTRWEKEFGVPQENIKVIYNGVDKELFSPQRTFHKNRYPTVVAVARIDPVKDIMTMIRSAVFVKEKIPEVRFVLYGSVSVPVYYEECRKLVKELQLEETFIFAGHTDDVPTAYRSGDVIALSSISEAFPYSVVEAMMVGKAIVATDVGGIKEALGDTGFLTNPGEPRQLAEAITVLLANDEMRLKLGAEARERALNYFTIERVLDLYLRSYQRLAQSAPGELEALVMKVKKQKLLAEKGYAFAAIGYWREAVRQFRMAAAELPDTPAVPVILTEIAMAYNNLGEYDKSFLELEKAEAIGRLLEARRIA